MSGSSKSLARTLSLVFENWEDNLNWRTAPSAEIKEVFTAIDAYKKKHTSAGASLNETLKTVHDTYIGTTESIPKETFFLEVLTRLVPVLNSDNVKLCLQRYLRPVLDGSGYDSSFVEQIRLLLLQIVSQDDSGTEYSSPPRADSNSSLVIDSVLAIYFESDAWVINNLNGDIAVDNHSVHLELNLSIELNASLLLKEIAPKNPLEYFNLLDKYFRVLSTRQKACLLLCEVLSLKSIQIECISSSPLLLSLVHCLSFDYNLSVISAALCALLMLSGKMGAGLAAYLPELLFIFGRLTTMARYYKFVQNREAAMTKVIGTHNIEWEIAYDDSESLAFDSSLLKDTNFDTLYLLSVLYGLFPLNVLEFGKLPIKYFQNSKPSILPLQFLAQLEESFLLPIYTFMGERARTLLKRFVIHPNIINHITSDEELRDPTRWILVENNGLEVGEEELLSACSQLNPQLHISSSDNVYQSRIHKSKEQGNDVSTDFERNQFPSPRGPRLVISSLPSARHSVGLAQSDGDKNTQVVRAELSLPFSPKLPPLLTIDSSSADYGGDEYNSIQFNKIDFAGRSSIGLDIEFDGGTKRGSVSSLFSAHEKLYTDKTSLNSTMNADPNHFAVGNIQITPNVASDLLSKQLKYDFKTSKMPRKSSDTTCVLDDEAAGHNQLQMSAYFYQKQIMLLKNEIEFLRFLKRLSMLNCATLKKQLHSSMHEPASQSSVDNGVSIYAYNELVTTLKEIELGKSRELELKNNEVARLNSRVEELNELVKEMRQRLSDSETSSSALREIIRRVEQDGAARDSELLEFKARAILTEKEERIVEDRSNTVVNDAMPDLQSDSMYLDEESLKEFNMQSKLKAMTEDKKKISSELERTQDTLARLTQNYEKQIEVMKRDLGEQLRKSMDNYEQKIRELNLIIAKFETLLEEKNTYIMQLSSSRPIQIPSIGAAQTELPDKNPFQIAGKSADYFSHLPSTPLGSNAHKPSTPSSKQSSTQSVPIIRGRGGYQKRIKKIM